MNGMLLNARRRVDVPCTIDIEQTQESFHAHAVPENIELRPGDVVLVHGAPSHIDFGDRISLTGSATVLRAGWLERLRTRISGLFEITELYEVGFQPKETP